MNDIHFTYHRFIGKQIIFMFIIMVSLGLSKAAVADHHHNRVQQPDQYGYVSDYHPRAPIIKDTIDLLIVYDQRAEDYYTGRSARSTMQHYVTATNAYLRNSGATYRFRLVATEKMTHRELGLNKRIMNSTSNILSSLVYPDSRYPKLINLRNQTKADLVVFLTAETSTCGYAAIASRGAVLLESEPFGDESRRNRRFWTVSVTHIGCGAITFAHELGHNMGLRHSKREGDRVVRRYFRKKGSKGSLVKYGLGHGVDGLFATIMASPSAFGVPSRIPRYSNPNLSWKGVPTGQSGRSGANAVRATNIFARYFSNISNCEVLFRDDSGIGFRKDRGHIYCKRNNKWF